MPEPDKPGSRCLDGFFPIAPTLSLGFRSLAPSLAWEFGLNIPNPKRRIQRASQWHRNRNIQRASTITTRLLTIMRPRITIIRRSTITRSASMKRPRSTPRQLGSTASLPTSIRRTLTRTRINDVHSRGAVAAVSASTAKGGERRRSGRHRPARRSGEAIKDRASRFSGLRHLPVWQHNGRLHTRGTCSGQSPAVTRRDPVVQSESLGFPESVEGNPLQQAVNDVVVQSLTTKLQQSVTTKLQKASRYSWPAR